MKLLKDDGTGNLFTRFVYIIAGEVGVIESSFGKTGKFKARFSNDQTGATGNLRLPIKRYIYDPAKKIYQP